jgi:formylglycine-generating enzyme required for sulfatase activity
MGTSPSKFKGDDLPVEQVSFEDVQTFLEKLSIKTALKSV